VTGYVNPGSLAGKVHQMDLNFAILAFIASLTAYTQTIVYPSERCNRTTLVLCTAFMGSFLTLATLQLAMGITTESLIGMPLLILMAWGKAMSSFSKYLYQIGVNYQRGGTRGVSKVAYLTDFSGSCFAIAQL